MVNRFLKTGQKIFAREQTNILSAASVITIASFISAAFGLLKTRLLLSHFASDDLAAYLVALRFPELIFQLFVVGALSAAFIPVFSKYLQKNSHEAYHISSSVMNVVLIIFIALSTIIFINAEWFNDLITADTRKFTFAQIELAADLSRVMIFAQLLFAISSFLTSTIQAQKRFLIPALSPVAYNVGIIAGIVLFSSWLGIYAAAAGVVIGAFLHLLMQLPLAFRLGFSYQPVIDLKHIGVKEMFSLMPPRILTLSVTQIELFSMVYFATAVSTTSLIVLQIAQQLIVAPVRMFSVPIGQASLPFLSKENAAGALEEFKATFLSSLNQILYLAFLATALMLILRVPLVRLAYGSKEFPWPTTLLTARTVAILSISIFAQGALHIVNRAFYALHNTKVPFIISLASVGMNILLSYLAVFRLNLGVLGLALSVSISSITQLLLLLFSLNQLTGGFKASKLLLPPLKMLLATAITGISLWIPMHLLEELIFDTTRTIPLLLLTMTTSLIGLIVYLFLSLVLRIEELNAFLALIKRIGNWRKVLTETEAVVEPATQAQEVKPA